MAAKVIGGMTVTIAANTQRLQKGLTRARSMVKRFANAAVSFRGIAVGIAAASAAAFTLARRFEELSKTMNRSLSIMGNVSKAMRQDLTSAAIDVARVTQFSAREAGEAYFFLASAGLDAAQSMAALPQVAQFAQAGNFNLARATDLATDAQSALGLTVKNSQKNLENLTHVTDVLVKANTLANASVEQFSEALTNKAGAALRLLNKDIEEGAAVLAVYADQGVKGAEAGTALGIVMRDLQTKALKFKSRFQEAGVAVFDSAGKMRNFADIIEDLERKLGGLSDAQKKATLLNLGFSDKSVAFVQQLIGASDKIREYELALRGAQGTTADVAGKMLTPMEKSLAKLGAAFDRFSTQMRPVVEMAAGLVDSIATLVRSVSDVKTLKIDGVDVTEARRKRIAFHKQSLMARGVGFTPQGGLRQQMAEFVNNLPDTKTIIAQEKAMSRNVETLKAFTKTLSNPRAILNSFQTAVANARGRAAVRGTALSGLPATITGALEDGMDKAAQAVLAGIGRAGLELFGLQIQAAQFVAKGPAAKITANAGRSTFQEKGTAEAFRQLAATRNQGRNSPERKAQRTREKQERHLADIAKNTIKNNGGQPANFDPSVPPSFVN